MTLAQGGKVTSGAFPSPSPHSEPGVASQPPGLLTEQQQSRHRERHHEPPHVRAPISQPHSCLHSPTPCELRALAGALKALREGWDVQGLHQDTPVSPHVLYNCPFPLSAGHAAQDTSKCCPSLSHFTLSRGHVRCLAHGNNHLDGAGETSSVPREFYSKSRGQSCHR